LDKNILIYVLGYVSAFGTLVPFLFAIFRYKYLKSEHKWLLLLFGLGSLTELVSRIYANIVSPNNVWLFNIYQILETTIIIIFYSMLTQVKLKKRLLYLFIILFTIVSVYQISNIGYARLNDLSFSIESIIVVLLTILNFHSILKKQVYTNILNAPIFWINSGFLIFYFGNLFLHIFSKYLQVHAINAFFELWVFHSMFNIILYILISIGFWKTKKSQI
jgi:hypothetical protein